MKKNIIVLIIATLAISLFSEAIIFVDVETTGPFYVNGESSTIDVYFGLNRSLSSNERIEVGSDVVGSNLIDWISTNNDNDLQYLGANYYSLTIHVAQNSSSNYRSSSNLTIQLQEHIYENGQWYWYPIDNSSTQLLGH